ncbi:DUF3570 domain-containing protein [uncultured Abyssibacter sp.]|uniref:DUF3570 domain-containing protein n=1 Tax=uncultured Abyssibacter sp. TaxID=2320202 RepID=UPI0032B0FBFF
MAHHQKSTLAVLTAAASALPVYSGPARAGTVDEPTVGYRYSYYSEDDLPDDRLSGGSASRYEISTHQFQLSRPLGDELELETDVMIETMSGASPWFITPGADGRPVQVMSGATIQEDRYDLMTRLTRHEETGAKALLLGISTENDYLALTGGLEGEWEFDERQRTLSAAIGYSYDQLDPTDGGSTRFPDRIISADRDRVTSSVGFSQIFSARTVAQVGASLAYETGYLSDPYKQVFVDGDLLPDARPDRRVRLSVSGRLRHYLKRLAAAVHLDARFYSDDWGVYSDTVEAAWLQNIGGQWRAEARLRWYEQSGADFYSPYFNAERGDAHYSSDYRLSPYGAVSVRVAVERAWPAWVVSLAAERYEADASYALQDVAVENPGLVQFSVISAAIQYRWN